MELMHLEYLNPLLTHFEPVSLEEMNAVRLMNRIDTKYTTSIDLLPAILLSLQKDYRIQEITCRRNMPYETTYLDTEGREMFMAHQNGRTVREKIRVRTYKDSGLTFLEVKNKNNKGRTDKKRILVSSLLNMQEEGAEDFLQKYAWYSLSQLSGKLQNSFNRITLVNKQMTERLTIDTNVCFQDLLTRQQATMDQVAIIELKRDGNHFSPVKEILHQMHVLPVSISKYCLGSVLTNPALKYNRFKPRIRKIEQIQNQITI